MRTTQTLSAPHTAPCNDEAFLPFALRPDFPRAISQVLDKDIPLLSLHVTTLSDATLVGLSWCHLLADALGLQALLHSWSLVMAGQESRVPPILDPQTDMVLQVEQEATKQEKAGLARPPPSEIIAAQNLMTTFQIILYAIKTIFQSLRQPPWEERLIYLPHNVASPLVTSIKEKANLASPPFISTGDALTAWFTKLTASFSPSPISLIPFVNIRYQFPSLLPTTKLQGVHLQNMLVYLHVRLTGTLAKDVPDIAAEWKRQTVQQREQPASRLHTQAQGGDIPRHALPTHPGETGDTRILVNNLINMDLVKLVNFKPAVVKQGDLSAGRENPLGGMVCFMTYRYVRQFHTGVHMFQMLGSDHSGGHYMFATMQKERWAGVERELERLAKKHQER